MGRVCLSRLDASSGDSVLFCCVSIFESLWVELGVGIAKLGDANSGLANGDIVVL